MGKQQQQSAKIYYSKPSQSEMTWFCTNLNKKSQNKKVKQITKVLAKCEEDWNDLQKKLGKKKIIEKLHKGSHQSFYTTKLLQQCKQ